jgi:protein ImuB
MLWLCSLYPDLPAEALSPPRDRPTAVVERTGGRKILTWIGDGARARGLKVSMSLPSALGLVPDLLALTRSPSAEKQALEGRACWAYQFGIPVTFDHARLAVWVEVGASIALNGGWPALATRLRESVQGSEYRASFGVAPTIGASFLMARGAPNLEDPVSKTADLLSRLSPLSLDLLPFARDAIDMLRGAGLRSIGDVLKIPSSALALRVGPAAVRQIRVLLGESAEAWKAFELPSRFRRHLHFVDPIESIEGLLFPLRLILVDLTSWLHARDAAVQVFSLRLIDSRRRVSLHPIGLSSPTRDVTRLLLVLRAQLERLSVGDGIIDLAVEADRFEEFRPVQDTLFGASVSAGARYAELCERLTARLGREAVRRISVSPDQRPEASQGNDSVPGVDGMRHPPRPLWLLPQPVPMAPPRLLGPPERIELGWWVRT